MIWKKQPVGSKLSDLQNNKASKDTATQSAAGLMSATDKTKLDGVAAGATAVSVVNALNSDSTTSALSAAQGKALNNKIGYVEVATTIANVSSLDALKTGLQNVANDVDVDHNKLIRFYSGFTSNGFIANRRYKGYLMVFQKSGSTATNFTIIFEGEDGHNVFVGYRISTWTVEELALNSKLSWTYINQLQTVNDSLQFQSDAREILFVQYNSGGGTAFASLCIPNSSMPSAFAVYSDVGHAVISRSSTTLTLTDNTNSSIIRVYYR